jgi:hypothetical protein
VLRRQRGTAELVLPTGELSDTLIYGIAKRAAADGRPAAVFYFSDFDPSGHQMPISLARKLQGHRVLKFPDLVIEVHHVALTLDQVIALDLPSTPLKYTEKRADHWRSIMGREQTEIDALAALRPEVLNRIAREATAPFWDATLDRRAAEARDEWLSVADEALHADPSYEPACAEIRAALENIELAVAELRRRQERAAENLRVALPPVKTIEAELDGDRPAPLFYSAEDFTTASRRLIERRRLK